MSHSISATIVADSTSPTKDRLTTFVLVFPRIILAEFNTHRAFSRNSASSRAIPFAKMVESVETNPFVPIAWQKDHKGMQGSEYLTDELSVQFATSNWLTARDWEIKSAKSLNSTDNGYEAVTKQLCNRLLEPFMYHKVIMTSSEDGIKHFFNLRCPRYIMQYYATPESLEITDATFFSRKQYTEHATKKDLWIPQTDAQWYSINESQAELHIQALAEAMFDAMNERTPKKLAAGEWHIPFSNEDLDIEDNLKVATANCARVSYTTVGSEKTSSYDNDIKLYNTLLESGHLSPFEHCAQAMAVDDYSKLSRNFVGFKQYRAIVEEEG
jgi:thymidylate synthase ThyX